MKQVLFVVLLAGCLAGFAGSEVASTVPKDDKAAIESFFREFVNSFNSKDAERVRKMSGETWRKWSKNMNDGVKLENVRIANVEFDRVLKVFAKVPIVENDGKIDRAAPAVPPRETKEEFLKRIAAEDRADREQREARRAAEQRKVQEQFWEWIRKQKKRDGEGAK